PPTIPASPAPPPTPQTAAAKNALRVCLISSFQTRRRKNGDCTEFRVANLRIPSTPGRTRNSGLYRFFQDRVPTAHWLNSIVLSTSAPSRISTVNCLCRDPWLTWIECDPAGNVKLTGVFCECSCPSIVTVNPGGSEIRLNIPTARARSTIRPVSCGTSKIRCESRYPAWRTTNVCRPVGNVIEQGV